MAPTSFATIQGIFELHNGGGLFGEFIHIFAGIRADVHTLANEFQSHACKAIWDFEGLLLPLVHVSYALSSYTYFFAGIYASSRHIPGVRFAGISHPGLIGTAPSHELLATWTERESKLVEMHANAVPPVAYLPLAKGAHIGQDIPNELRQRIMREGARTVPGREHGGNCDVHLWLYLCAVRTMG